MDAEKPSCSKDLYKVKAEQEWHNPRTLTGNASIVAGRKADVEQSSNASKLQVSMSTAGTRQRPLRSAISFVHTLGPAVLRNAIENYKTTGELTREDFISLHWVFGSLINSAFEIIDSNDPDDKDEVEASETFDVADKTLKPEDRTILILKCTVNTSPATRVVVRVTGSKGSYYWIPMTNENYVNAVISKGKTTSPKSPYNIKSFSQNRNVYICQCMSFKWRKDICKHILAALFYVGITDENEYVEVEESEFNEIQKLISNSKST